MTIKEMKVLTEYLKEVFKDIFMTKEDGRVLESKIDKIQNTIDAFAKQTKDNTDNITVHNARIKSAEDWIDQASPKLGLKFER